MRRESRHALQVRRVVPRQDHRVSRLRGRSSGGQCTTDGAQRSGETEFAEKLDLLERAARAHLAGGCEDADGDGEIETPAILRQISGREVDGDAPGGQLESRVDERCPDPLLAFFDLCRRQTHDVEAGQTGTEMDFDLHDRRK